MIKFYLYLILFASSSTALVFYECGNKNGPYSIELMTFASIGIPASIGALLSFILDYKNSILLSLRCLLFKRNQITYVSLSYLFKIKLKGENKYLVIRGNKIKNQYQPVGGVYKKFSSLDLKWKEWGALETKNNPEDSDDLRFEVKRKFIPEIRKWFYKRKNRETDVWREFCEELIITGLLPEKTFRYIKPEFLYSKEETLIFRKGKDTKQFLIYDIYTLNLSSEQEQSIVQLHKNAAITERYAFVEEKDLDKELFIYNQEEYQLGYHARYLKSKTC